MTSSWELLLTVISWDKGQEPISHRDYRLIDQIMLRYLLLLHVMTCANLWPDWIIKLKIKRKWTSTKFELGAHKCLVKWASVNRLVQPIGSVRLGRYTLLNVRESTWLHKCIDFKVKTLILRTLAQYIGLWYSFHWSKTSLGIKYLIHMHDSWVGWNFGNSAPNFIIKFPIMYYWIFEQCIL